MSGTIIQLRRATVRRPARIDAIIRSLVPVTLDQLPVRELRVSHVVVDELTHRDMSGAIA